MSGKSRYVLLFSMIGTLAIATGTGFSQSRSELVEGAKKEGSLVLSWGTGTMGGIEGARAMERAFNKTYGLNIQFIRLAPPCRSLQVGLFRRQRPAKPPQAISSLDRKTM